MRTILLMGLLLFPNLSHAGCMTPFVDYEEIISNLRNKYNEKEYLRAYDNNSNVLTIVYLNTETQTFTILWVNPYKKACIISAGTNLILTYSDDEL